MAVGSTPLVTPSVGDMIEAVRAEVIYARPKATPVSPRLRALFQDTAIGLGLAV